MKIPLTRAATVAPFCDFLVSGGSAISPHLERVGITPEVLSSPESPLPLLRGCQFVQSIARKEGIKDIGLAVGSRAAVSGMGLFGKELKQSLSLKTLLEKLVRMAPLVNTGARVWTDTANGSQAIRVCVSVDTDCLRTQIEAYSLLLLVDAVRLATGPSWRPKTVWLNTKEFDSVCSHQPLSEAEVRDCWGYAAVEVPFASLGCPVGRELEEGNSGGQYEIAFENQAPPTDFIGSLTAAIQADIGSHCFSIERSAELLGSSARTLQRQLEIKGLTYRDLVDRVRFHRTLRLLKDRGNRLGEIARELGYRDAANFTHAFRRWTGVSPSQFRQRLRSGHEEWFPARG